MTCHLISTSDWNSLSAYQPEFVHDIIGDEVYDDEDDSNGIVLYLCIILLLWLYLYQIHFVILHSKTCIYLHTFKRSVNGQHGQPISLTSLPLHSVLVHCGQMLKFIRSTFW